MGVMQLGRKGRLGTTSKVESSSVSCRIIVVYSNSSSRIVKYTRVVAE